MPNRRKLLAGGCILLLAALVLIYVNATRPRPVLAHPETAQLVYVRVDFPEDSAEKNFYWAPATPEEEETAQAILDYLGQCQEKRVKILKGPTSAKPQKEKYVLGGSGNWPFMTIMVNLSARSSRGILLGPSEVPEGPVRADFTYDASASSPRLWGRPGILLEPDALRSYVLEVLDLPEDLL